MQKKEDSRIKTRKCQFFDTGFCKYKEECTNKHPDKVCDDPNCSEENCDKRHPNPCKFGLRYRFRKKKVCLYSHDTLVCDDGKVDDLAKKFMKKIETLENQVKEINKSLNKKDSVIQEFQQKLDHKDSVIQEFQHKFNDLEDLLKQMQKQNEGIEERFVDLSTQNETFLNQSIAALEDSTMIAEKEILIVQYANLPQNQNEG